MGWAGYNRYFLRKQLALTPYAELSPEAALPAAVVAEALLAELARLHPAAAAVPVRRGQSGVAAAAALAAVKAKMP